MDVNTLSLDIFKKPYNELTDIEAKKVDAELDEYFMTNGQMY